MWEYSALGIVQKHALTTEIVEPIVLVVLRFSRNAPF